jgi:hypothetical protein
MPGASSRCGFRTSTLRELTRGLVDLMNANQISSQIWHDQEISGRVHDGVVWVRSLLSRRVDALSGILQCLKRLTAGQREFKSRHLRGLTVRSLATLASTRSHRLTNERWR